MERSPQSGSGPGRVAAVAGLVLAVLATACGDGDDGEAAGRSDAARTGEEPGPVVVSVPPLAFLAGQLLGDRREVVVMVPPGASPAMYEPTMEQMRAVTRASLYVAVGHPRFPFEEAWLGQIARANPAMQVVAAGTGCAAEASDPHLWMSPACVRRMVETVAGAVGGIGVPESFVEERKRRLLERVDRVDARVAEILAPHRGRSFLVFHPALGYLARDYGLTQRAIQRGATRPGPGELARLVHEATEEGIHTVFVQPQFSREAAELVASELPGGRVETVDPLARDWPENLVGIARRLAESFPGSGPQARTNPTGGRTTP